MGVETYRSSVVGLAKVAVNSTCAGCIHYATILLLDHIWIRSLGDFVSASEMDIDDVVPLFVVHVGKRLVSQNSGIVNHNVDPAISVNCRLYDSVSILDRGL